ncbi:ATP-dependent DNA helicase Rep [Bacillus canaveralius]|uniref:DNA 3'-5' helicase n=1 Tax=Bacillus canaveralius TaxID=1403243 RepID=A0A2N5GKR4_9BACI|nr:ATP-dependent helicase [Bacillus canaveralius]PLR82060.1 ATP-dependent DNA helicase Rep [Bacillus canaveralius]PLR98034.1 ATP-dependent DNA helicase Rep [Bacillus canaveralius]
MQTAVYQGKPLHLKTESLENFQKLYDKGKKGELTCPTCGETVRFHFSIENEPSFRHTNMYKQDCPESPTIAEALTDYKTPEYIDKNGFRIPKARQIQTVAVSRSTYKPIKRIASSSPFLRSQPGQPLETKGYFHQLQQSGIGLDLNQMEAAAHTDGALLVLAGAGSGKTRVLTARTAYLINEKNIDPKNIMLVTFTAKAAAEMKTRLSRYPATGPDKTRQLVAGTFHSIFYRILSFHDPASWSSEKLLKQTWRKEQIVKEAGKALGLDDKEFAFDLALLQISYWKNSLLSPSQVKPDTEWEEKTVFLFNAYEKSKQSQSLFDFDDMLVGCYHLFLDSPDILGMYQNRFQYFLIDEFQDINKVQYELIKLLSASTKNVCAVGDDDQSIYAFRGSNPAYLLEFEKDFPDAKIVVLSENYRSNHEIVSTANRVISENKQRRPKEMKAQFCENHSPVLFYPFDEEQEATMIVTDIQEKIAAGADPGDFAILFRTHTASRAVFERLAHSSLPFKVDNEAESFYDRFIIKGMLAFLKLSLNEDDQSALQPILPALFMKQAVIRDVKANSILNDCSLLEALSRVKTGFAFQERKLKKLVPVVRSLSALSPLTAIETVEKELGYQEFVKKRGNEGNSTEKGSDDLRDLKVAARNFTNIREFIEHAEHMMAMMKEVKAIGRQLEKAITLSTIHKAKGLEYDTVYLLGAVDGSMPHDHALEAFRIGNSGPLEEERRLLYVAITRAKDQLYISVPEQRRGKIAQQTRFLTPLLRNRK